VPPVGAIGGANVEGVADVPAEESASPAVETPGPAAPGPTLIAVTGVGAVAEVAVEDEEAIPIEAGAVPVGGGGAESDVAGAVPDGVRMSKVAVVGAAPAVVGVAVSLALAAVVPM